MLVGTCFQYAYRTRLWVQKSCNQWAPTQRVNKHRPLSRLLFRRTEPSSRILHNAVWDPAQLCKPGSRAQSDLDPSTSTRNWKMRDAK